MKNSVKILTGVALCSLITACAHDNSTTSTGSIVTSKPTPTAVPKLSSLLSDGKTTLSGASPEVLESKSKGTVTEGNATVTAKVLKDTDGGAAGLRVTVADSGGTKSYDLTKADSTRTQVSSADGSTTFSVETGAYGSGSKDTVDALLNDTATSHYHTIFGYSSTATGDNQRGYVALGSETTAANMPKSATATYVGKTHVDVDPTSGFTGGGKDRDSVKGAMTLNADFAKGTINGSVSDVKARLGSNNDFASVSGGAMTIGSGKITGDDITATMTPNAAVTTAIGHDFTGTVAAKFYGPNADEVGGTVAVKGPGVTGSGFLTANKQ